MNPIAIYNFGPGRSCLIQEGQYLVSLEERSRIGSINPDECILRIEAVTKGYRSIADDDDEFLLTILSGTFCAPPNCKMKVCLVDGVYLATVSTDQHGQELHLMSLKFGSALDFKITSAAREAFIRSLTCAVEEQAQQRLARRSYVMQYPLQPVHAAIA